MLDLILFSKRIHPWKFVWATFKIKFAENHLPDGSMISAPDSVNSRLKETQLRGGYALILKISNQCTINTRHKQFVFTPGFYVYAGSALGQGGIEARIRRHLRVFNRLDVIDFDNNVNKRNTIVDRYNWHIDLLLRIATDFTAVYACSTGSIECQLVQYFKEHGLRVIIGFGSTDCNSGCGGHLMYLLEGDIEKVKAIIIQGFKHLGFQPIVGNTYTRTQS